jgi:hypothetical protein
MFSSLFSAAAVVVFAAQVASTPTTPPPTARPTPRSVPAPLRLSGCVSGEGTAGVLTFAQTGTDTKYRLGGLGVQKYVGQRVEIVGTPVKHGLVIRGGLLPSPNVAAQAGSMDPARVAVASQPGGPSNGTGIVQLPEFRVASVHTLGSCVTQP